MAPHSRAVCWIRRDLRLSDHRALAEACTQADSVAVVFVFDSKILDALEDRDDRRLTFIHQSLRDLDLQLRQRGSRLVVLHGDPVELIPEFASAFGANRVTTNFDVEPYAISRDAEVENRLQKLGIGFNTFKDHVVFARKEVLNQSGEPFRVYTPYSKAWRARLTLDDIQEFAPDLSQLCQDSDLADFPPLQPIEAYGFTENDLWLPAGETAACTRLKLFQERICEYGTARDTHGDMHTSGLSVYLRHGTISIRACVRASLEGGPDPLTAPNKGADKWLSELIWREFYQMILSEFPHVVVGGFKRETDRIQWPGDRDHFELWCRGETGYPVVDAAMRCFNATGWMHNRLRMVVAMFLTKDLLLDWRLGEAYFARKLLDFDLAANNGGWQWSASTGVDAQPYFRVFNPYLQSLKFDPEANFITEWCPELREFGADRRHWPHDATFFEQQAADCILGEHYPHPIVDHQVQKAKAIALFGELS